MHYKKLDLLNELQRYEEAVTTCDRIIELAPDSIDAYSQKIVLLAELQRYEEAVTTCDRIIELAPNSIDARFKKLDLLEKLQRYDSSVEICGQIIRIDHNCADAYYRKGKALEKLEHRRRLNPYRARLTPISQNCKEALEAYETASELSPDNTLYHESIGDLLKHFGKINQSEREYSKAKKLAIKYPAWIDNNGTVFWLFYLLPISINTFLFFLLVIFSSVPQQIVWILAGLLLSGEFIISTVYTVAMHIMVKDQKYHLYKASKLFLPASGFAIEWVIAAWLVDMPKLPTVLIFLLIGFSVNAFLYFSIDIYESKTIILTYEMIVKVLRTLAILFISMLRTGILRYLEYRKLEHINSGLRQEFNKDITLRKADNKMDNFLRPESRISGDNSLGYDKDGYNKRGYNRDGYDRKGYNSSSRDRNGYNRQGYNRSGRDKDGYDRKGYNSSGRDRNGRKKSNPR